MSLALHELGIDRLSFEARLALVHDIWDSIAVEAEKTSLSDDQRQEVDRRLAAYQADPQSAVPWEMVETAVYRKMRDLIEANDAIREQIAWSRLARNARDSWTGENAY
jgi:putative addiction module component (TIGR02574 family)